jgi:hypothetical protein
MAIRIPWSMSDVIMLLSYTAQRRNLMGYYSPTVGSNLELNGVKLSMHNRINKNLRRRENNEMLLVVSFKIYLS